MSCGSVVPCFLIEVLDDCVCLCACVQGDIIEVLDDCVCLCTCVQGDIIEVLDDCVYVHVYKVTS